MGQDEVDLTQGPLVCAVHVELRPRQRDEGEIDGVADMTHAIDVAEPNLDVRREARHPATDDGCRRKTFGWALRHSRTRRVNSSERSSETCFERSPLIAFRGGKLAFARSRYLGQERSIRRRRVSSTVRIVFAGTPAITVPAGNSALSGPTGPLA